MNLDADNDFASRMTRVVQKSVFDSDGYFELIIASYLSNMSHVIDRNLLRIYGCH